MENKDIIIGKPYLKYYGDTVRLCSLIKQDDYEYEMWYETERDLEQYLCTERADAFLVAVLPFAMKNKLNIKSELAVSEKLYYQLAEYFIPALSKYTHGYHAIKIDAELVNGILPNKGAVGTGMSGGVDSFYTFFKHSDNRARHYNITHLTFFNVGSSGDNGGERSRELFKMRREISKKFAVDQKLPFVWVDSNISEFIGMPFVATHTYRSASAVLALQKLFAVYLYSAGHGIDQFSLSDADCSCCDLLNAHCLSTENTLFYISGLTETRIEKLEYISRFSDVLANLNVCVSEEYNCSHCEKCLRTMIALYAMGKLDIYSSVFDVKDFKEHLPSRLAYMLGKRGNDYYRESYELIKKNKLKIPKLAYFLAIPERTKELIRPVYNRLPWLQHKWKTYRWGKNETYNR